MDAKEIQADEFLPQWKAVTDFGRGEIDRLLHKRREAGHGNAFRSGSFMLADFQAIVKSITSNFGAWWEQECQAIKTNLISMDSRKVGRVPLSDFYHKSGGGEWRFSESEAYLRELGALDESSSIDGPQVIIPNYLLGASNCIVTSTYYHVCCVNECEALLGEMEEAVQGPVAPADEVFMAVLNVTVEEDHGRFFGHLQNQLRRIAEAHHGKVPLHGRLFGQWMHRAFPRECPFPHRAGSTQSKAPLEFGDNYLVTEGEILKHTNMDINRHTETADDSIGGLWASELEMDDEELLADYAEFGNSGIWGKALSALTGGPASLLAGGAVFFLVALFLQDQFQGVKDGPALLSRQKIIV